MLIKLVCDKEIHLYKGNMKFSELKIFCKNSFRKLPESFHFVYFDDEGDELMISSNLDSVNFKSLFLNHNNKAVKLHIRPNQQSDSNFQMLQMQNDCPMTNAKDQSQKQGYDSLANNSFEFEPLESGSSDRSSQCQSLQLQSVQHVNLQILSFVDKSQNQFINLQNFSLPPFFHRQEEFAEFQIWRYQNLSIKQFDKQQKLHQLNFNTLQKLVEQQEKNLIQEEVKRFLNQLQKTIMQQESQMLQQQIQNVAIEDQQQKQKKDQNYHQEQQLDEDNRHQIDEVSEIKGRHFKEQEQQQVQYIDDEQSAKQNNLKIQLSSLIDQKISALLPNIMKHVEGLVEQKINKYKYQVIYGI